MAAHLATLALITSAALTALLRRLNGVDGVQAGADGVGVTVRIVLPVCRLEILTLTSHGDHQS